MTETATLTRPGAPRATVRHPARLTAGRIAVAVTVAVGTVLLGILVGPVPLAVGDVLTVLLDQVPGIDIDHGLSDLHVGIITRVRVPRALLAFTVGMILSAAGASYQAVFRNPLADPYLLGAASGAGLGATIAIISAGGGLAGASLGIPPAAFLGATIAVAATYALGVGADRLRSTASLILAGVAISAVCSSAQTFLLQRNDESIRDVYAWLFGRMNLASWQDLRLLAPYAIVSLGVLLALASRVDVLSVGDDEATALGARPDRLRIVIVLAATLGTAAAVAVSGLIGFVGIIVPHAVRLRTGPANRRIVPLAALYGGAFLCLADLVARTALAPAEIPIGVVTALVGAPTFLLILRTGRGLTR